MEKFYQIIRECVEKKELKLLFERKERIEKNKKELKEKYGLFKLQDEIEKLGNELTVAESKRLWGEKGLFEQLKELRKIENKKISEYYNSPEYRKLDEEYKNIQIEEKIVENAKHVDMSQITLNDNIKSSFEKLNEREKLAFPVFLAYYMKKMDEEKMIAMVKIIVQDDELNEYTSASMTYDEIITTPVVEILTAKNMS